MKTIKNFLFFAVCIFFIIKTAIASDGENADITREKSIDSIVYKFQFSYSGEEPWEKYNDYSKRDEKIFGRRIAQQFSLIDHCFIIYSGSENDYHPNIVKPSIYNSLIRLKQYYKNILKEDCNDNMMIRSKLEIFLIKGYLCYTEETDELEEMFQEAETIEEIIKILNSIKLIN